MFGGFFAPLLWLKGNRSQKFKQGKLVMFFEVDEWVGQQLENSCGGLLERPGCLCLFPARVFLLPCQIALLEKHARLTLSVEYKRERLLLEPNFRMQV